MNTFDRICGLAQSVCEVIILVLFGMYLTTTLHWYTTTFLEVVYWAAIVIYAFTILRSWIQKRKRDRLTFNIPLGSGGFMKFSTNDQETYEWAYDTYVLHAVHPAEEEEASFGE